MRLTHVRCSPQMHSTNLEGVLSCASISLRWHPEVHVLRAVSSNASSVEMPGESCAEVLLVGRGVFAGEESGRANSSCVECREGVLATEPLNV
jgi:hypothetical protein